MSQKQKNFKLSPKAPKNSPNQDSSINLVTWKEIGEAKHREAELAATQCVSKLLRDVESFVSGGFQQKSSCSIIPLTSKATDEKLTEDRRLANWKRWLSIRDEESAKITKFTYRRRKEMLLNMNPNDFRQILNRKEILDKTADNFGASNFWKIPEKSRENLYVTLPKSEKVDAPVEIIYTQTPDLILKEQKILKKLTSPPVLTMIEEKLEKRVKLFDPLLDHLALKVCVVNEKTKISRESTKRFDSLQLSHNYEKFKKVEKRQALIIAGIKVDSDFPDKNILIDIVFEGFKEDRQTKFLRLENSGEIAMNLTFKKAPEVEISGCRSTKTFFFDKFTLRIIPGELIEFPLHFYPIEVGVSQEKWILSSYPEFSNDCEICVCLFGQCGKKFNNNDELMKIESEIIRKAAELDVEQTIKDLMKLTVKECKSLRRELFKDPHEIEFAKMNPKLFYQPEPVENLTQIFSEVHESEISWNFDVDALYKLILNVDDIEKQKDFYNRFMKNFDELRNVQPNTFCDDEKASKFSMVRISFGIFFDDFETIMNNGRAQEDQESCIKSSLRSALNKMICILES